MLLTLFIMCFGSFGGLGCWLMGLSSWGPLRYLVTEVFREKIRGYVKGLKDTNDLVDTRAVEECLGLTRVKKSPHRDVKGSICFQRFFGSVFCLQEAATLVKGRPRRDETMLT